MKILLVIATLYAISYLPTGALCPYRHDESLKKNPVNVPTNKDNSFIYFPEEFFTTTTADKISSTTEYILSRKDNDAGSNINNKNDRNATAYLPTGALCPYRHDESFKKKPVNVPTNKDNSFIYFPEEFFTTTTSTTNKISSTTENILSSKDKNGSNINNKNNRNAIGTKIGSRQTSKDIFLGQNEYYDYFNMLHDYQLSKSIYVTNHTCTEKNERHALPENSEEYIECMNGTATLLQCLNGLHVDPEKIHVSPCQYAIDVPNTGEARQRKPVFRESECPHDFAYYKIVDKYNCSSFRICEFGIGYDYNCPSGLAFRSDTLRCDWPHKVPECDAEAFAKFVCPDKKLSLAKYGSPVNCQEYYVCIQGVPRRQMCEEYMAFHPEMNNCIPADEVKTCNKELQLSAKLYRNTKQEADYDIDAEYYLNNRKIDLSFQRPIKRKSKIICNRKNRS